MTNVKEESVKIGSIVWMIEEVDKKRRVANDKLNNLQIVPYRISGVSKDVVDNSISYAINPIMTNKGSSKSLTNLEKTYDSELNAAIELSKLITVKVTAD